MINLSDNITKGRVVRIPFNTVGLDSKSITIAVNGTLYAVIDGSTTEITTGLTLSKDFDARTGSHFILCDTSGADYLLGADVLIGSHTMTVDGVSPINIFHGRFGIQMANAEKPVVGLALGGGLGYVDLPATAVATNGFYENALICVKHAATGKREWRFQSTTVAYTAANRRLTVDRDFSETVAAGDEVEVFLSAPAGTPPNVNVVSVEDDALGADAFSAAAVTKINAAIDAIVAAIKLKTDNLPSDPADASVIAAATASILSDLATVYGLLDTEVAAIKSKTDLLTLAAIGQAALRAIALIEGNKVFLDTATNEQVLTDTDGTTELGRAPFIRLESAENPLQSIGG